MSSTSICPLLRITSPLLPIKEKAKSLAAATAEQLSKTVEVGARRSRALATNHYSNLCLSNDILGIVSSSASLAKLSLKSHTGKLHSNLSALEHTCDFGMGVNGLLGSASLMTQMLTGAMFYETDEQGNFIIQTETVEQSDGTFKVNIKRTPKSHLSICSKVSRLASKLLGNLTFLGSEPFHLPRLAKHARVLGGLGSGLSALSSAFGMVDDAVGMAESAHSVTTTTEQAKEKYATIRSKMLSFVCNFIDLVAECVGLIFSFLPSVLGPHALLIVGVLWLLSSAGNFIQDLLG